MLKTSALANLLATGTRKFSLLTFILNMLIKVFLIVLVFTFINYS